MAYEFGGMSYDCERDLVAAKVDFWLGGYISAETVRDTLRSRTPTDLALKYVTDHEMRGQDGRPDNYIFVEDAVHRLREEYLGEEG